MRTMILATVLTATMLAACGGGGGDSEPAADALEEVLNALSDGQAGRAWDMLHPEQQAIVSRDAFIQCYSSQTAGDAEIVEVEDAYDEEVEIPGTGVTAPSRAITARIRFTTGGQSAEDTDTSHMFPVGDGWTWVMNAERIEECRA